MVVGALFISLTNFCQASRSLVSPWVSGRVSPVHSLTIIFLHKNGLKYQFVIFCLKYSPEKDAVLQVEYIKSGLTLVWHNQKSIFVKVVFFCSSNLLPLCVLLQLDTFSSQSIPKVAILNLGAWICPIFCIGDTKVL